MARENLDAIRIRAQYAEDPGEDNVLVRMSALFPVMSRSQKKIANYIMENYDRAVVLTAARLAEETRTSGATVVRFAERLGYGGYPEFQSALYDYVRGSLDPAKRMDVSFADAGDAEIIQTVLAQDISNLQDTRIRLDGGSFARAVDQILGARSVYIAGLRACAPLAQTLGFYLQMVRGGVTVLTSTNSSEIFEQMIRVGEDDAVIGISFPRYSMRTLKAMEFASDRKAHVIAITDGMHSPMTLYSSCNLYAECRMASIVDSMTAPMSVINALAVALCMRRSEAVAQHLERLGRVWDAYEVSERDEIDFMDARALAGDLFPARPAAAVPDRPAAALSARPAAAGAGQDRQAPVEGSV